MAFVNEIPTICKKVLKERNTTTRTATSYMGLRINSPGFAKDIEIAVNKNAKYNNLMKFTSKNLSDPPLNNLG